MVRSYVLFYFIRSRWEADVATDNNNQETHISYNVTNFEFLYEPFYVSSDLTPPHDERFLGYGFTRNTQVRASLLQSNLFL